MCRDAMAHAVLALSACSHASASFADVSAGRKAPAQLLPKSTALGLNALRLGPRPGILGAGGKGGDPAAAKRALEEASTLLRMSFENAASVFECSGKKVVFPVVNSSISITPTGPHMPACFAPEVQRTSEIESN